LTLARFFATEDSEKPPNDGDAAPNSEQLATQINPGSRLSWRPLHPPLSFFILSSSKILLKQNGLSAGASEAA
jgi:hypothetical protein